jgi:hypothetical protein
MPASIINLNDTVPATPSGEQNVHWQKGATTGNDPTYGYPVFPVSANIPNTGGAVVKTANYTAVAGDCGRLLIFNSSTAVTLTLPATAPVLPAGAALSQWQIDVQNIGAGILTINRGGLLIDTAAANLSLYRNQGLGIETDGTNYFTRRGAGSPVPAFYTITPSAGNATVDLANALTQRLVLNATPVTILAPVFGGGAIAAGMTFTLILDQDATGGRAIPTFTSGAGGFAGEVGTWQIDGTLSTRTTYVFLYSGTGWGLLHAPPATGGPIT